MAHLIFDHEVQANHGLPPICLSYDNATCHILVNSAFLGLLPRSLLQGPFWFHCRPGQPAVFKCWPYRTLLYSKKELPVLGLNDPPHTQKNLVDHLRRSTRKFHFGALWVDPQAILIGGCPKQAWLGKDHQSDSQAAQMLNPRYLKVGVWFDLGVNVFAYVAALVVGSWSGSALFSPTEIFLNSLSGYYLLLLNIMMSHQEHGSNWEKFCFAKVTMRNWLSLAAHAVLRVLHWPTDLPYNPACCAEDGVDNV